MCTIIVPVMPKGPDTKFDADYVAPVMPKGPDTKFDADYVAPVNGKGGDGKAGSNNAGEVKHVDGWDGIQRGGKKGGKDSGTASSSASQPIVDQKTSLSASSDLAQSVGHFAQAQVRTRENKAFRRARSVLLCAF